MNNTDIFTSLDDTNELKRLIVENPDLPLLIFCGEESYCGEWTYNAAKVCRIEIEEVTLFDELYIEKDEFEEEIADRLDPDDFENDEAFDAQIKSIMERTEFVKAIVIYVG